jgi:hypothetical protein
MNTDEVPPPKTNAENEHSLRQRLLREIAGSHEAVRGETARHAGDDDNEDEDDEGYRHPFSDLNITAYARRLEALFNPRWLTAFVRRKKNQARAVLNPANDGRIAKHS